jgi:hypothetical protein
MTIPIVTVDLPVTADQANSLLAGLGDPDGVVVTHGISLGGVSTPGRWRVFAVRQEYALDGPQHWALLEWLN